MNRKTVLKSLDDPAPEVLEPEPAGPPEGNPKPNLTEAKTQRENRLHGKVLEHPGCAGYRHWGINE